MGGMGGQQQPGGSPQPAAMTAQPKDVWQALEMILKNVPTPATPQQQQPQKQKPQLNFLKGVPGF
jgi:hypothetical protein